MRFFIVFMSLEAVSAISGEHFRRSILASLVAFVASLPVALFGGWLVALLFDADYFLPFTIAILLCVSLLSLSIAFNGFRVAQWMVTESVCVVLNRLDGDVQTVTTVNEFSVKGRGNVVALSNAPMQSQETIRLVPVKSSNRLIEGVDEKDLRAFVEGIFVRGFSQRAWMGQQLPTGRTITTFADYDALIQPLLTAGVIVDRKERSAGKLAYSSADEVKEVLGL
ncbi:MAG TPA: hypothetical protein VFD70_24505 [Anaerolineae bacterium]|nr:hypothetical protein [Anaerolineae bacterium]